MTMHNGLRGRLLGNHRMRPARSAAAQARPKLEALTRRIAAAKARGDTAGVERLERERAWLTVNSLR